MKQEEKLLGQDEAAAYLGVHWRTLNNWRHKTPAGYPELPFQLFNRAYRYSTKDLNRVKRWMSRIGYKKSTRSGTK